MRHEVLTTKYGDKIAVFPNDHISNKIKKNGIYDTAGVHIIESILRNIQADCVIRGLASKPIALDIGANVGNHALVMTKYCEWVLLFEPQRNLYNLLQYTRTLNRLSAHQWTAFNCGLSNETKEVDLFINTKGNLGMTTVENSLADSSTERETCKLEIGDNFHTINMLSRLDFIKIDIEGHEVPALMGLKNTIKKHRPIILMEWNNAVTRKGFRELDIFDNYEIYAVISNRSKIRWYGKRFIPLRRFFFKLFNPKTWIYEKFHAGLDYAHVLLIPKEKYHLALMVGL